MLLMILISIVGTEGGISEVVSAMASYDKRWLKHCITLGSCDSRQVGAGPSGCSVLRSSGSNFASEPNFDTILVVRIYIIYIHVSA